MTSDSKVLGCPIGPRTWTPIRGGGSLFSAGSGSSFGEAGAAWGLVTRCLTSSNKKLVVTSATLVVTGALLVVTRSY